MSGKKITLQEFFAQTKILFFLGLPIFIGQISQMSMGFVDTIVASRHSTVSMAGVAMGGSFWLPLLLFGIGVLNCILALVAQNIGQKKTLEEKAVFWRQGVWLSIFLATILITLLIFIGSYILSLDNIEAQLSQVTSDYLSYIRWGMPAFFFLAISRFFLEAHGFTRPFMIAGFVGLLSNIPLNYIFVFGYFGMPELGGAGCGLASLIVSWLMFLVVFAFHVYYFRPSIAIVMPDFTVFWRMFRIGLPAGLAQMLEVSSFAFISFFIAPLGSIAVAGHQIAMNASSLTFMCPLSLGVAVSIRVATCVGAERYEEAAMVRKTGQYLSLWIGTIVCFLLIIFRHDIAYLYSHDPEVVKLGAFLLIFTALYQITDMPQVVLLFALRAYNDTKAIFMSCLFCYWGISLPLGYILCYTDYIIEPIGPAGFWIGLIVSLSLAFFIFLIRIGYLEKMSPEAIQIKIAR